MTLASVQLRGCSMRAMARMLRRSASTISREIRRNSAADAPYRTLAAQSMRDKRRSAAQAAPKLAEQSVCWRLVQVMLGWRWSPQQIAGTLKRAFGHEPQLRVSHETIYAAIYAQPRGELRRQLVALLRHGHSKRLPCSRGDDRRERFAEMVSIHLRPPEVEHRLMPGHWEGDLR